MSIIKYLILFNIILLFVIKFYFNCFLNEKLKLLTYKKKDIKEMENYN